MTFKWLKKAHDAFDKAKDFFLDSAMLHHADCSQPFILECDANKFAIGDQLL